MKLESILIESERRLRPWLSLAEATAHINAMLNPPPRMILHSSKLSYLIPIIDRTSHTLTHIAVIQQCGLSPLKSVRHNFYVFPSLPDDHNMNDALDRNPIFRRTTRETMFLAKAPMQEQATALVNAFLESLQTNE